MARKKTTTINSPSSSSAKGKAELHGTPAFPYTTKPASLRKFLRAIPDKPKPPKVNGALLKTWGLRDNNDHTIVRVLKTLGFISSSGEPTDTYIDLMSPSTRGRAIDTAMRSAWEPFYASSHRPHAENDDVIRSYFNIHSGGSENTIRFQIQTFKVVAEFSADAGAAAPVTDRNHAGPVPHMHRSAPGAASPNSQETPAPVGASPQPEVHIDIQIHISPESSADQIDQIFESMGKHLYRFDAE
jgi:hypothetical protein